MRQINKLLTAVLVAGALFVFGVSLAMAGPDKNWADQGGVLGTSALCSNPSSAVGPLGTDFATIPQGEQCGFLMETNASEPLMVYAKMASAVSGKLHVVLQDGMVGGVICQGTLRLKPNLLWQAISSCKPSSGDYIYVLARNASQTSVDIHLGAMFEFDAPHTWANAGSYVCPAGSTCNNPGNALDVEDSQWAELPPISGDNYLNLYFEQGVFGKGDLHVRIRSANDGANTHAKICFYGVNPTTGAGHQACSDINNNNLPPGTTTWLTVSPPDNNLYTWMDIRQYDDATATFGIDAMYGWPMPGYNPGTPY